MAAFRVTLPVLMGYLSIGIAFGLMLDAIGLGPAWAFFMSTSIYAGSGQYLAVDLLSRFAGLYEIGLLTFIINFRHLVYGFSLFEKLRGMGLKRLYMIFALTDETYALLSGTEAPPNVDKKQFYFIISVLDHIYWVSGSVIGSIAGALLRINTEGIDFAMTALFIVIAVDQWWSYKSHLPAIIGTGCTFVSLFIFGPGNMLPPALFAMVALLLTLRPKLEEGGGDADG